LNPDISYFPSPLWRRKKRDTNFSLPGLKHSILSSGKAPEGEGWVLLISIKLVAYLSVLLQGNHRQTTQVSTTAPRRGRVPESGSGGTRSTSKALYF
jgi:hypothetical protein